MGAEEGFGRLCPSTGEFGYQARMKQTEAGQGQGSRTQNWEKTLQGLSTAVTTDLSPGIRKLEGLCGRKGVGSLLASGVFCVKVGSLGGFLGEQQTFDVR